MLKLALGRPTVPFSSFMLHPARSPSRSSQFSPLVTHHVLVWADLYERNIAAVKKERAAQRLASASTPWSVRYPAAGKHPIVAQLDFGSPG